MMMCADAEPITRWNRLSSNERSRLNDNDPLTNVTGFHSGFEDMMGNPILLDISVAGAPHALDPTDINNRFTNRWGLTSFNNSRESAGQSGTKYCFDFSSPVPFEVNSEEHKYFFDGENVRVTASLGGVPTVLSGSLHAPPSPAAMMGNNSTEIHFQANQHYGTGVWWAVSSSGQDVDRVCVEYYREGLGQGYYGREPFTLLICNSDRVLFDDPFAIADPDNNPPVGNIRDNLSASLETYCVEQAASGIAGNMDVTFRAIIQNNSTNRLTNLQLEDDLRDHIPSSAFVQVKNTTIDPSSTISPANYPSFNPAFDGINAIKIFDGLSGRLEVGETLVLDLVVEMNPNILAQYDFIVNQSFAYGIDPNGSHSTATSDAPAGAPGDTGGPMDGLALYIPSINGAMRAFDYTSSPTCEAGNAVEVTIELNIVNTGNVWLDQLSLTQNFAAAFGPGFISLIGSPVITQANFAPDPGINPAFDGDAVTEVFLDPLSAMGRNDKMQVQFRVLLDPSAPGAILPLKNDAVISARGLFDGHPHVALPSGCLPSGELMVSDIFDGGFVPESQNTGFAGDTGGHDDGLPLDVFAIGLAKTIIYQSPAGSGIPGNLDVTFRLVLENTGGIEVDGLSLTDDIQTMLGNSFVGIAQQPAISFSSASANPGIVGFPNIFDGTGGLLETGQRIIVDFKIEMDPDAPGTPAPLTNFAEASASGIDFSGNPFLVSDLSDSGHNTRGTNPGEPGDLGCDDDPLLINLPAIRSAMHIAGLDFATSGTAGHFDVIVEVLTQNTGNVDLGHLSLIENLSMPGQLGSAFFSLVGAPQILAVGANGTANTASINPAINPAYDGTNDLLDGSSGLLKPGELFIVRFRYEVNPDAPGAPVFLKNQVTAFGTGTGISGANTTVSDLSDSGFVPQSNNPGRPGDSGNSNDPTPLTDCHNLMSGGLTCNNNVQVSVNENCTAELDPTMVLEGEEEACADRSIYPLGTYYEVFQVMTLQGLPLADADPSTAAVFEIDGSYVGQTLSVKIKDVVNQNSCWGYIHLEDKLGPVFDCPTAPVQVACDASIPSVTAPGLNDNCDPDPAILLVGELVIDSDICDGDYRIRRTYTGSDLHGNPAANQCIVEIQLNRGAIAFPPDVAWACEQYSSFPSIVDPIPLHSSITDTDLADGQNDIDASPNLSASVLQNTGSGTVAYTGGECGYNVTNSDEVLSTCGNSFKIIRTWTVIDWCTGNIITTDAAGNDNQQLIKIEDEVAPVIAKTPFSVNANIAAQHPFPCRSQGFLPPPETIADNCNNGVEIQIITPIGGADLIAADGSSGGFIPSPGLPLGTHDIVYRATDACGNVSEITVQVQVADNETPVAVCDELTDVSIGTNGLAEVFAETFDDGSTDNCCLDHFEVRRMNDPCDDGHNDLVFGPSVMFCCNDIGAPGGQAGNQMVVLRVFDCFGNFNDCMVEVAVDDKLSPQQVSCPPAQTIDCDSYANDFETQLAALNGDPAVQNTFLDAAFGTPSFFDNCSFEVTKGISFNLSQCLEGRVRRTWSATDPQGLTSLVCQQDINVYTTSDWVVEFPEDLIVNCGASLPDFGEPQVFNESCEMIAISYDQDTFTVVPDACFKIVRTWAVINWCTVGDDVDQEVVEVPENQLGLPFPQCDLDGDGDCDGRTFRDSWNASVRPDNSIANQQFGPDTDPDSDPWDGYIIYRQVIKVLDETDPVFTNCDIPQVCIGGNTCSATVLLPTHSGSVIDCSPSISVTASIDFGGGNVANGFGPFLNVPEGVYDVTYTATDNCNNQTSCSTTVTVVDCKKPTPKCKDGLVAELMEFPTPMVPVSAWMLNDGSNDNCSDIIFSFSPDVADSVRIFDCNHVDSIAPVTGDTIEIWLTDAAGNQDFCRTVLDIQDNFNYCAVDDDLVVNVGGGIRTEMGIPVENVEVNLSGQNTGDWMTGEDGQFQFSGIARGNDLSITPEKNDEPLNGVTTYDLVLISRHILDVERLDSPYKLIAADANRSGAVTTFDLVEIRKLILRVNDEFPNNSSWRFVAKDYQFPDPNNPWAEPFPEVININNVPDDLLDADFTAIKIGDVNASAEANFAEGGEERSYEGALVLETNNQAWAAGESVFIDLKTTDFAAIGFQFTLQFDPAVLEFENVIPSLTEAGHFGLRFANEGFLTISWNDHHSTWTPEESIVKLAFKAKQNGRLSEALQINGRYTANEAYDLFGETMAVELAFPDLPNAGFELLQNVPNPFNDKTVIGFRLGVATSAVLSITDISGRVVKRINGEYQKGYNEVELRRDELPEAGIFYYRLDTPEATATKMMLLME